MHCRDINPVSKGHSQSLWKLSSFAAPHHVHPEKAQCLSGKDTPTSAPLHGLLGSSMSGGSVGHARSSCAMSRINSSSFRRGSGDRSCGNARTSHVAAPSSCSSAPCASSAETLAWLPPDPSSLKSLFSSGAFRFHLGALVLLLRSFQHGSIPIPAATAIAGAQLDVALVRILAPCKSKWWWRRDWWRTCG